MGIKGRRKKLRQREALALQQRGEQSPSSDEDANLLADSSEALTGKGPFQPPVDALGNLKMKKSDLFRIQDMEIMEQMQEEHQSRRQKTSSGAMVVGGTAGRKRRRWAAENSMAEEVKEIEQSYLGHHYDNQDLFEDTRGACAPSRSALSSSKTSKADERADVIATRRSAAHGALYSHPLIGLDPVVVDALQREGFHRMTCIQERSIPYALEGYDLLGQARTGSGKTLAFSVPLLHLTKDAVKKFPNATVGLVLAPTKELCVQTHSVLTTLCQHIAAIPTSEGGAHFHVQLITGGTKVTEERRRLTSGMASIVVGTPGRIHDHIFHSKGWDLSRLRLLVLDEADRMLADGFQRALDAVIAHIPKGRQTFLFSATNSKSVRELARLSLSRLPLFINTAGDTPSAVDNNTDEDAAAVVPASQKMAPYRVYNDPQEDGSENIDDENECGDEGEGCSNLGGGTAPDEADAIPSTLRQFAHIVPTQARLLALYVFVKQVARRAKAMVFCSTVASATFHCQMMGSVGFHDDVMMLHGHMKHRQRVQTFQLFTEWKTGILFCTDVAARGLDIPHVTWILQYDPPLDPTEYIHRIGRTARAGNVGSALLFLTPEEGSFIRYLSNYGIHMEKYPMPHQLPRIQEKLEHVLQLDEVVAKSAVTAFRAHVGAYQSHILKETFNVRRLDLEALSKAFALTAVPHVTLPRDTEEEKRNDYIKGRLKSLNRRRLDALRHYEDNKTRPQWENGTFVGVTRPSLR